MKKTQVFIFAILIGAGAIFIHSQQEVVLSIKDGMPVIPLAFPDFISQSSSQEIREFGKDLHQIVSDDLNYSRVFQLYPPVKS